MSPRNMLNGAQVIVDYLIQEKVPQVFGLCGHGNIQFIDALYERSDDIKTISVHHESVAGFMADVYYRVSGRPTATFTSCGPGSANLPISLGNAFLDSVPFLAVTGNVPTSQFNRGAFQELYRHYQADFPSTVRVLLQEGVPADARRDGAARGPAGLEDHDHGPSGPGGAGCSLRRVHGIGRRGSAERAGLERQYFEPLRRRSRRRRQGGRHAARRRAAGDDRRPGRALWRRRRGIAEARRAAADSGGGFGQRPRRDRLQSSAGARSGRARRPLPGQPRDASGRRAAGAGRALRRSHLEFVDSGLFLHHPADAAHSRRHRSRGDRPQLSGRARPDGRRAHLPAADPCRTRSPRRSRPRRADARKKWLAQIDSYRKEWDKFVAPGFSDDTTPINPQRAALEIDKALPEDAILVSDIGVHHNWLLELLQAEAAGFADRLDGLRPDGLWRRRRDGREVRRARPALRVGVRRRRVLHARQRAGHRGRI